MDFRFENQIGDVTIVNHSAEALQAMIKKFGFHVVYDYQNGSNDADSIEDIKNPEQLVEKYPNIKLATAQKYFAGEAEIYDVLVENEGRPYHISFYYPIPDIGYEDDLLDY